MHNRINRNFIAYMIQLYIIHHHFPPLSSILSHQFKRDSGELVKINSLAGSGKTTTLAKMCWQNPRTNFLVVMVNKHVQTVAATLFPQENTRCVTAHGLAYKVRLLRIFCVIIVKLLIRW